MTDKERLMEILKVIGDDQRDYVIAESEVLRERLADALLQHGVTLPPEQEEPTPTEMVKGLLEKGWTVPKEDPFGWESPDKLFWFPMKKIRSAYRRAFPPKKRITVDVWRHEPSGCVIGPHQGAGDGWDTKGTATFEVPEEE